MNTPAAVINTQFAELEAQRDWALTRCAQLAAEIAELKMQIEELKNKPVE